MLRSGTCDAKAAGVACVILEVATSPVFIPPAFAASRTVGQGLPSSSTPTAPLYVLIAHEKHVAPAAESVIIESLERVRERPTRISSSGSMWSSGRFWVD
eukprot:Lithocolla_globosa_v1_NODE_2210_length_2108_cov_17.727228.p2 type:complete len:100 gc:universal NODE_2210_length_2108_cov_17.727228:1625-1924(+)